MRWPRRRSGGSPTSRRRRDRLGSPLDLLAPRRRPLAAPRPPVRRATPWRAPQGTATSPRSCLRRSSMGASLPPFRRRRTGPRRRRLCQRRGAGQSHRVGGAHHAVTDADGRSPTRLVTLSFGHGAQRGSAPLADGDQGALAASRMTHLLSPGPMGARFAVQGTNAGTNDYRIATARNDPKR
jgi:hypothetical protein